MVYPNYRLALGFGLHHGWAIEGSLGSIHKVDASYLSPHVTLSDTLEAATKQVSFFSYSSLSRVCPLVARMFLSHLFSQFSHMSHFVFAQYGIPILMSGQFVKILSREW